MKGSYRAGFNFGLTSGIITTLGLMTGLYSSTNSTLIVTGGILTIAIADALSDAIAIHVAVESQIKYSIKKVWETTIATFLYKFLFAALFIPPLLILPLEKAVLFSAIMGLDIIFINSLILARIRNVSAKKIIAEHLLLTLMVIGASYFLGLAVSTFV
jgi:vacuolar iron transporter family protein